MHSIKQKSNPTKNNKVYIEDSISLNIYFDINTRNNDNSLDLLDNNFSDNDNKALGRDSNDNNNIILSATPINNNSTTIFVGQTFDNWYKVEEYINTYAISQEFATRLQRTDKIIDFTTKAKIIYHYASSLGNKSTRLQKPKSIAIGCNKVMFDPKHHKLSN
ncbi:8443_t:CDS:2, partial [Racocetra persica]